MFSTFQQQNIDSFVQSCSVNSTDDWHIYGAHAAKNDSKQTNQTGLNNITSSFLSFSTCFHIIFQSLVWKTTGIYIPHSCNGMSQYHLQ